MRSLKNTITYKLYPDGIQFLQENEHHLNKTLETSIETAFFILNAKSYTHFNRKNYAFSFQNGNEILLLLKVEPYNAVLFGSGNLCSFAANVISEMNLVVEDLLGEQTTTEAFLKAYQERNGGEIQLIHSMKLMMLKNLHPMDTTGVFPCDSNHLFEIAKCYQEFELETFHYAMKIEDYEKKIKGNEKNFYAYIAAGKIVSIASMVRNFKNICAISHVYTNPSYRGKGYSAKIVTKLCQRILEEGKTPYLFVDTLNPISNHLYLKLGFDYLINQMHYHYEPILQAAVFAGGCFWCIAEPFYSCEGVKRVISGFIGGEEISPTYEEVKNLKTHHREAILIEYDSSKVSYKELLEIYFSHIDPFDAGGQFIDRGENYTCGIYTSNLEEKQLAYSYIQTLEKSMNQKICVDLCEDAIFYPAEEEHQNYALKNPEKMEEEFIKSGRKKR